MRELFEEGYGGRDKLKKREKKRGSNYIFLYALHHLTHTKLIKAINNLIILID